tara:strand:- start:312 stop:689 length:378 start_codon:yes stop_codon:yes gene_type:complete
MNEKETIEALTVLSYSILGVKRGKSRKTANAQARAAIGVSMYGYFTQGEVAKALHIDRSTISHYSKKHSENMIFWTGYRDIYATVSELVIEQCRTASIQQEIDGLDRSIEHLEQRKNNLKARLIA